METVARGRALAHAHIAGLVTEAAGVRQAIGRSATLAILASDDADGHKFVQIKVDALAAIDVDIRVSWLSLDAETRDAVRIIEALNADRGIDGIFLQFPLPPGVDSHAVANAVVVDKDIDGSGDAALVRLSAGVSPFKPAAPAAARDLLLDELRSLAHWNVVIVGDDDHFTRALDLILMDEGSSVEVVRASDAGAGAVFREADAIVVTEALPHEATHEDVLRLPLLLDAGYYLPPRPPGFVPERLKQRIAVHLTQYGNVGPLTVAHLAESTIRAAAG